jgi:hypothetical protein
VPILGRVPAGKPFLSEENTEGFLSIPSDIGSGKQFALLVQGDSMIGAGIMDGDRVIVKQQTTAENGEIVCALIDGEATLKRFYKKDGVSRSKRKMKSTRRSSSPKASSASPEKLSGFLGNSRRGRSDQGFKVQKFNRCGSFNSAPSSALNLELLNFEPRTRGVRSLAEAYPRTHRRP